MSSKNQQEREEQQVKEAERNRLIALAEGVIKSLDEETTKNAVLVLNYCLNKIQNEVTKQAESKKVADLWTSKT